MKINKISHLKGTITVPGDKSVSHRSAMFSALSNGTSKFTNFLKSEDCLSTLSCFNKLGVNYDLDGTNLTVYGKGINGLTAPTELLYTGNSGTTTRLITGILSGQAFASTVAGDASIAKRPMKRVITPLTEMGAKITSKDGGFCPLEICPAELTGIDYTLPVASAQLKSAVLLAGLFADGSTTVRELVKSRDHTERMLRAFGADITVNGNNATVKPSVLTAVNMEIPSDISSAAFFMVAASIVQNSCVTIKNVGINPTRSGIVDVLLAMGADIEISNERTDLEPVCDMTIRTANLKGTNIGGDIIPRLIDELPVIAVAAAMAEGTTVVTDAEELKVKESNRIAAMVTELTKAGVDITETDDGFIINGKKNYTSATFESYDDHRIAMALSVFSLTLDGTSEIENPECVNISYPTFFDTLKEIIK